MKIYRRIEVLGIIGLEFLVREVFKYLYQVLVKSFGGMVVPLNDNKISWRNILISSMSSWELLNHGGW